MHACCVEAAYNERRINVSATRLHFGLCFIFRMPWKRFASIAETRSQMIRHQAWFRKRCKKMWTVSADFGLFR